MASAVSNSASDAVMLYPNCPANLSSPSCSIFSYSTHTHPRPQSSQPLRPNPVQLQLETLTRELSKMKADNLARAEELRKVRDSMGAMQDGMLELARDHQHLLKWVKRADQQFRMLHSL